MILDYSPDAPICNCGNRGCFESLASGNAIARMAKEMAASYPGSFPASEKADKSVEMTAEKIAELALQGNESALKILKDVSYFIGVGFVNLVNILNPEKIIVTGSAINPEDIILKPAIRTMKKLAFSTNAKNVEVVKSENGNKAGLFGAAALFLLDE
jgi:glucokinase